MTTVGTDPVASETGPLDTETGTARPSEESDNTSSTPSNEETAPDDDDGDGADAGVEGDTDSPDEEPAAPEEDPCVAAATEAKAVLQQHCAGCHDASPGSGSFSGVLDPAALVQSDKVVPERPEDSRIYIRMSEGTMPPSGPLSDEEIGAVGAWIACGAE